MSRYDEPDENYARFRDALCSVGPGAGNRAGIALTMHKACRQVIVQGGSQWTDPAVRLMCTQLSHLRQGNSDLPLADYKALMDACRARACERTDTAAA